METKTFNVKNCARCGKDHNGLLFTKYIAPTPDGFDYYGFCPNTKEPLQGRVVEKSK